MRAFFVPFRCSERERKLVFNRLFASAPGHKDKNAVASSLISAVESKSGVLLTHVSVMIAISGVLLTQLQDQFWFDFVLTLEFIVYLLLALVCVRCQYQFSEVQINNPSYYVPKGRNGSLSPHQQHLEYALGELYYREWLIRVSIKLLYLLTLALIVSVSVEFLSQGFSPN